MNATDPKIAMLIALKVRIVFGEQEALQSLCFAKDVPRYTLSFHLCIGLDFQRQNSRYPGRCQRMSVDSGSRKFRSGSESTSSRLLRKVNSSCYQVKANCLTFG